MDCLLDCPALIGDFSSESFATDTTDRQTNKHATQIDKKYRQADKKRRQTDNKDKLTKQMDRQKHIEPTNLFYFVTQFLFNFIDHPN
jgi:hypothetical protein